MRQIKIIALAFIAVSALSAITMVSSATAALPEVLPEGTVKNPITFTDKGAKGTLLTLGKREVTCEKNKSEGSITSLKLGQDTILFEGCKSEGMACTGLGQPKEEIKAEGEIHFWYGLLTEKQQPAVVFLVKETHFECGGFFGLVKVSGCVAGLVEPINTLTKTLTIKFGESKESDPDFPKVINEKKEDVACTLDVLVGDLLLEDGAIIATETAEGFKQINANIEVLLMA